MRPSRTTIVVLVAVAMVGSIVALPALAGDPGAISETEHGDADTSTEPGLENGGAATLQGDDSQVNAGLTAASQFDPVEVGPPATDVGTTTQTTVSQEQTEAVETGVDQGIALVQSQGIEVTQEQRTAALEGAREPVSQSQTVEAEQVQAATTGAVHGTLIQKQSVNVTQIQAAVGGATAGGLSQSQSVNATQLQSATWGGAHGAVAQSQRVSAEQIQVASAGAAAGAASEAGAKDVGKVSKIQEAAQGSAYGALTQYQSISVEQRQQVTLEHVQHAAIGAAAGSLEGSTRAALEQEQRVDVRQEQRVETEQRQRATIKQIQKAAAGAAKGALVQEQTVSVEQTQAAARGASRGSLKQVQSVSIVQVQRISITQVQEASFGAAKGAISQSQEATVEQIQAAADGAAGGALVQRQTVSVTQIQSAATGAAEGAVTSALQRQEVTVEQVQAAAFGASDGAVSQTQLVAVTQVQRLASGAASGALVQSQEATVTQVQIAARTGATETAQVVQSQRIGILQLQTLTQETAADAIAFAIEADTDDVTVITQHVKVEVVQRIETIDRVEGTASIDFSDQEGTGEEVTIDEVSLSEGGFVAVYEGVTVDADPDDVRGVSSYLEAGEHENVTIELDEPLNESGVLVAVVHHDTNDDETFQYAESDGEEDVPYASQSGAPVLDGAFVTVTDEPAEPTGTLSVDDQEGEGESLEIDAASATVPYVVTAEYDGERVDSDSFEANETVAEQTLELEPPLEDNATVDVSVRAAADDAVLANDSIEYAVVEPDPEEPTANLTVADQTGDGETITVTSANASVEYAITVTDENGTQLAVSETFAANETIGPTEFDLEPPLAENATLEVAVVAAEDGTSLETDSVEYAVDGDVEDFDVEFTSCSRAVVTATLEEGDQVAASTGFYDQAGFGNTIIEDFVTVGDDVEAPFTGTIVFEIGDERNVTTEGDEVFVEVPDYGTFGTYISGISSPEAVPFAGIDYGNPSAQACDDAARPDLPSVSVVETTPTDDGINVTFGYENPNNATMAGNSQFVDGTTTDEPPSELEPGENTFTVEWTPESDAERLVWQIDFANYGYDDPVTAATPPAGEIEPSEPAAFGVSITEVTSPVERGDQLEVATEVQNLGGEAGTQTVALAIGDETVGSESVTLGAGEAQILSFALETAVLEPGDYPLEVATETETAETTVTIEASGEPAEFAVTDISAPESAVAGEEVSVTAIVENQGDLEGTQTVTYSVDEQAVAQATVSLAGGQSAEIPFSSTVSEGTSTHTVGTDDDQASVTIAAVPAEPPEQPGQPGSGDGGGDGPPGETPGNGGGPPTETPAGG